jgi:hypothetical protein
MAGSALGASAQTDEQVAAYREVIEAAGWRVRQSGISTDLFVTATGPDAEEEATPND